MIINKRTNFTIKDAKYVSENIYHSLKNFDSSEWNFKIPEDITNDKEKIIYKIGFLRIFYKLLFPDYSISKIYKIINNEWEVFIGVRQMERNWNKYKILFNK